MLYLNETHLTQIGIDWPGTIGVIEEAASCIYNEEYAQPVKPYLRYGDRRNRIIAMPAYVGGPFDMAGIKWIASFPGNLCKGLPRAHSVIILNEAATGKPLVIVQTSLLSSIRTASVSGLILQKYLQGLPPGKLRLGIAGWGPIGQFHYRMAKTLLGHCLDRCLVYDPLRERLEDLPAHENVLPASSWQEAYQDADIFITCTVAEAPYIDLPPKRRSLHLNVSLRDYRPAMHTYFKGNIIVDDWNEVCRENTDIETMYNQEGLCEKDTLPIASVVRDWSLLQKNQPVFFNPMGMAVFDMAIASYYYNKAKDLNIGMTLG